MKNRYEINGDAVSIFIKRPNGQVVVTTIDAADLDRAEEFRNSWCYSGGYCVGYVKRNGKKKAIFLHRWLFGELKPKEHIDHFDHDTLNNRRSTNLRTCSNKQNHQNRISARRDSKSGVLNVMWVESHQRWRGIFCKDGKRIHVGYFTDIQKAEEAVKRARKEHLPYSQEAAI